FSRPGILAVTGPTDLTAMLEIGPGPGLATDLLAPLTGRHVALEVDPALAAALRDRTSSRDVEAVCADATDTGLDGGQFTSALCLTMIHHVPSAELQDELFAETRRLLQPGGVFVGLDSLDSPRLRALHVDDVFVPLDMETIGARLEAAGFVDVVVEEWDPPL